MGALATHTHSSKLKRYQRAGLLHLLCHGRDDACRVGRCRGPTLDDRDLLRNGQGRTRSRSLRSVLLPRVASSHEPGDDKPCIPRQIARRSSTKHGDGRFTQQTERKECERRRSRFLNRSPQLGITICAIRHLLACAVFLRQSTHSFPFEWINWRIPPMPRPPDRNQATPRIRNRDLGTTANAAA